MARMERELTAVDKRVSLTERDVAQIKSAIDSRYEALQRGQIEMLRRLDTFIAPATLLDWREDMQRLESRTEALETIKNQLDGAYVFIRFLGAMGLAGGIVSLIKLIHG